ncbi:hypothetical protein [Kurthia sibirica]|uniref:hypothetical protein n=1 Tax=Kurthia sibirica TaxID=202750 RepID=UPI00116CE031|nr:hypothetical protein [Kurthia sibirica]GEK35508.1 hypothetical protein KSI01_30410 [Kurthia sibirica]
MPKYVMELDNLFTVQAESEEEACRIALEHMPDYDELSFVVKEEISEEEVNYTSNLK